MAPPLTMKGNDYILLGKKGRSKTSNIVPQEVIENKILFLRGKKVMLDKDLAMLYKVETRALNQAVKRNLKRFPKDFMFQLTEEEVNIKVSQNVIPSKRSLGGSLPLMEVKQRKAILINILRDN
jgi:hypothetical protein